MAVSTPVLRSRFPAVTRRLAKAHSWAGIRKHKALSARREGGGGARGGRAASLLQATSAVTDCAHGRGGDHEPLKTDTQIQFTRNGIPPTCPSLH